MSSELCIRYFLNENDYLVDFEDTQFGKKSLQHLQSKRNKFIK
jgi:hypothetical protein